MRRTIDNSMHAPLGSDRQSPPDARDRLLQIVDGTTLALLVIAPLCMGGRHPVGRLVFITLIGVLVASWLWRCCRVRTTQWQRTGLEWLMVAGLLLVLLQIVPLPQSWLAHLSPAMDHRLPLWHSPHAVSLQLGTWSTLSFTPRATRSGLLLLTTYCLLFVVLVQRLRNTADVRRIFRWIAISITVMATLGLLQLLFGNGRFLWVYAYPSRTTIGIVRGAFVNQNHFAHFLALGIGPMFCLLAETRRDSWQLPGWLLALGLVLLAGLLAYSRAGFALILVASGAMTLLLARNGRLGKYTWLGPAVVGGLLVTALAAYGTKPLVSELNTVFQSRSLKQLMADRTLVWHAAWQAASEFSLVGTGAGTHQVVYPMYLSQYVPVLFTHAESGYLQVLEETGVAGLGLLLVVIATVANWCRLAWVRTADRHTRLWAGALAVSLLISMLHSVVDFVWYIPACMTVTVVLAACAWRLSQGDHLIHPVHPVHPVDNRLTTAADRFGWPVAAFLGTLVVMIAIGDAIGPARAARHWDQYLRLSAIAQRQAPPADRIPIGLDATSDAADRTERQVTEMVRTLSKAVSANPQDARVHSRLAALHLQCFEFAQKRSENRMELVQIRDAALLSHFPSVKAQDQWLGRAIGTNRRHLDAASQHARRAAQLSPLQGEAYVYLAQLGFLAGADAQTKRDCLDQALEVRPYDDAVLMAAGSEWALAGNFDRAIRCWVRLFQHPSRHRQQIIAVLLPRLPAEFFFRTFQPDLPTTHQIWNYCRKMGLQQKSVVAGRYWLASFARCRKADPQAVDADTWYTAYEIHDQLDQPSSALDCLRNAVAASPNDFARHRTLARRLLKRGRYEEARRQLQWCLRRRPDDQQLRRDLLVAAKH